MNIKKDWINFGAIGLIILAWALVIGLKFAKPETSLKIPLIISAIISVIGLISIFRKIIFKPSTEEKEIKILGEEEMMKIIKEEADKRWNNFLIEKPIEWTESATINKNIIYAFLVNLNLPTENEPHEQFMIIINATYPKMKPTIKEPLNNGNPWTKEEIYNLMNKKSVNPSQEPDTIEKETRLDAFGRPIETFKEIKHQKEEKKEEENIA